MFILRFFGAVWGTIWGTLCLLPLVFRSIPNAIIIMACVLFMFSATEWREKMIDSVMSLNGYTAPKTPTTETAEVTGDTDEIAEPATKPATPDQTETTVSETEVVGPDFDIAVEIQSITGLAVDTIALNAWLGPVLDWFVNFGFINFVALLVLCITARWLWRCKHVRWLPANLSKSVIINSIAAMLTTLVKIMIFVLSAAPFGLAFVALFFYGSGAENEFLGSVKAYIADTGTANEALIITICSYMLAISTIDLIISIFPKEKAMTSNTSETEVAEKLNVTNKSTEQTEHLSTSAEDTSASKIQQNNVIERRMRRTT